MDKIMEMFNRSFSTEITKGMAIGSVIVLVFWLGWNIGRALGGM